MTSASPRSILVLSGRYHIISNASLVNNCKMFTSMHVTVDDVNSVTVSETVNVCALTACIALLMHGFASVKTRHVFFYAIIKFIIALKTVSHAI